MSGGFSWRNWHWLMPILKVSFMMGLFILAYVFFSIQLVDTSFLSGWFLIAVITLLTFQGKLSRLWNKKKYDSAIFYRWHFILGAVVAFIFLAHLQYQLPGGWFEWLLAGSFSVVVVGGVLGTVSTMTRSGRLTRLVDAKKQESIWEVRERIICEAKALLEDFEQDEIRVFYENTIGPILQTPRSLFYYLYRVGPDHKALVRQFNEVAFKSTPEGQKTLQALKHLYDQHHSVEVRHAKRYLSVGWLLYHGPLAYLLFFMILIHVVMVHAFAGNQL